MTANCGGRSAGLNRPSQAIGAIMILKDWEISTPGHQPRQLRERGRRRTRQDQISPEAKIAGEIADLRSAPNEENLFLLPDRLSTERTLRNDDPAV
jgi:hypothetical protein